MYKKSFEEIYEYVSKNSFEEVELERKKGNKTRNIILIIGFSLSLLAFIILHSLTIFPILACAIIAFIVSRFNSNYNLVYKEKIIKAFINAYNENLVYMPNKGIPSLTYRDAGFEKSFDIYHSDDLIEGIIDDCPISFAEVHTQNEYEDSDGKRNYQTLFHGAFAITRCNKEIKDTITIHKDKGLLGKMFKKKTKLEMDSQEFEKVFDVHSENKIVAMQILTSDIMNLMLDFKKKYNIKFEITIDKYNIFTRFHTGAIFEPTLSKYSLSKEYLRKYYDLINFVFDFAILINSAVNETDI